MGRINYQPGRYWGQVTNQQLGVSSTGNPQIVISFSIVGRVNQANPEGDLLPADQGERSVYRSITDKTIDYVLRDLQKLGFTGTSFRQLELGTAGCCDIRGKELAFECKHGVGLNGQTREEWSVAYESNGPQVKPLDAKAASALDSMFGRNLRAMNARKPPAAAAPQRGNGTAPVASDVAPWEQDDAAGN